MRLALDEAERGRGTTSPNPMVGAVIVRDGAILATGFHARAGGPHAEVVALEAAGEAARGATMFVTLEPCCHTGRTGPCTEALLAAGIARVVVGAMDPNPRVAGGGVARLRAAGVEVETGLLAEQCEAQNEAFRRWIVSGRPFVTLKLAQSLDGRIAARSGDSRWVSGEAARAEVHALRAESDAVMVGSGTALADDPRLTVRDAPAPGGQPLRVLVDGALRVPLGARLFEGTAEAGLVVATREPADGPEALARRAAGAEVLSLPGRGAAAGRVALDALMDALGSRAARPVTSLLVEGGGALAGALIAGDLVDALRLYVAPLLIGGDGVPSVGALGLDAVAAAPRFSIDAVRRVGDDVCIEARRARREEAG
ncbi:MAG: bifunctional diaminohydroxyphosphoribosylaminopyrimidine deaminase/5-amino-6-(5-phosphoribosylamino)uracil reductase RibD [Deltaproteobacteria bacterium]|nr:bifunctional diaminohydroxyphosphoribosylaminopyrimidine deaminase/5-amino-6-(5-phosphoribosylamino)uracil reductase RibD [Deltaproteobacteria bacterium]